MSTALGRLGLRSTPTEPASHPDARPSGFGFGSQG